MITVDFDEDVSDINCIDILNDYSKYLIGYDANCVWINRKKVAYAIGNDNVLLINYDMFQDSCASFPAFVNCFARDSYVYNKRNFILIVNMVVNLINIHI